MIRTVTIHMRWVNCEREYARLVYSQCMPTAPHSPGQINLVWVPQVLLALQDLVDMMDLQDLQ